MSEYFVHQGSDVWPARDCPKCGKSIVMNDKHACEDTVKAIDKLQAGLASNLSLSRETAEFLRMVRESNALLRSATELLSHLHNRMPDYDKEMVEEWLAKRDAYSDSVRGL
jgi:hypothetical protein